MCRNYFGVVIAEPQGREKSQPINGRGAKCGREIPRRTGVYKVMKTGNYASGQAFMREVNLCAKCAVEQEQLEAAQQQVDLSVLRALPGKAFVVGVLDLADESPVESVDTVARRIRSALAHVDPNRLLLAPDCGMKYLPRQTAFEKLRAMVQAAVVVRRELVGAAS